MREYFTRRAPGRSASFALSSNWRRAGRQAIAILIVTAIVSLNATAKPVPATVNLKPAIGTVTVSGIVQINGSPVISGQTLFSGSSIRTSSEAESTIELGSLARLKLEAETSLTLESSELGLSASLDNGSVRVFVPVGIRGGVTTADASITTDASQPAVFSVLADSCSTTLYVQTGRLEMRSGNKVRLVSSGEKFSTGGAPLPPGPQQQNLSQRKKVGLFLGIGGAIAILLIALTGKEKVEEMPGGGCVIVPSGPSVGGC
ncbi:MAG TPA: hypothetical protein VK475_09490 [Pyrinomonadaceae bacterium]|nr:hypothetical protein [Pyrinomonadaceae bacterium]